MLAEWEDELIKAAGSPSSSSLVISSNPPANMPTNNETEKEDAEDEPEISRDLRRMSLGHNHPLQHEAKEHRHKKQPNKTGRRQRARRSTFAVPVDDDDDSSLGEGDASACHYRQPSRSARTASARPRGAPRRKGIGQHAHLPTTVSDESSSDDDGRQMKVVRSEADEDEAILQSGPESEDCI